MNLAKNQNHALILLKSKYINAFVRSSIQNAIFFVFFASETSCLMMFCFPGYAECKSRFLISSFLVRVLVELSNQKLVTD